MTTIIPEATNPWVEAKAGYTRPVAAPLQECARLLGVSEAELAPAAAKVAPYRHRDGHDCWSLHLLEKALWPERFQRSKGRSRRRKVRSGDVPDTVRRRLAGRQVEAVETGGAL